MHHFFVNPEQISEHQIQIVGTDVNHIQHVLRMHCGERVLISDGIQTEYLCELSELTGEVVQADILSISVEGGELPARLYLFQGLPKSDKMELIIQKAVELGVYEVIPVAMGRSIVKLEEKKAQAKVKRWNAIAESAAKQSKRTRIPEVTMPKSFKEALAYASELDVNLIPYEEAVGMADTKKKLLQIKSGMHVGIFIGPEGGFEDEEIAQAKIAGMDTITLGKRILRTETAGLAMLSILMFQLES